ncbi:MAG: hypothetical protein U9M97_05080 [Candidatus Hadarchaeota archaeon]|nr:hypothetical protein [Candidatus Hadarchaeota archaeon]
MTNKRENIADRVEQEVSISLRWPEEVDLPTIYANHLFISHAGPEFFLIFGEVAPPLWTEATPERLRELESIEIKPVVKIAISPEAMPAIAKAIRENVERFLAKKAKGEQREGK